MVIRRSSRRRNTATYCEDSDEEKGTKKHRTEMNSEDEEPFDELPSKSKKKKTKTNSSKPTKKKQKKTEPKTTEKSKIKIVDYDTEGSSGVDDSVTPGVLEDLPHDWRDASIIDY